MKAKEFCMQLSGLTIALAFFLSGSVFAQTTFPEPDIHTTQELDGDLVLGGGWIE